MKTKGYRVTWTIDIEATSPEVAAEIARDIQLDPDSIALVFEVFEESDRERVAGLWLAAGNIRADCDE